MWTLTGRIGEEKKGQRAEGSVARELTPTMVLLEARSISISIFWEASPWPVNTCMTQPSPEWTVSFWWRSLAVMSLRATP